MEKQCKRPIYPYIRPQGLLADHEEKKPELQLFWANEMQEIQGLNRKDIKNHGLPLARVKKIMKAEEPKVMVSAEAVAVLSKACELFVTEVTLRAWSQTCDGKRRTVQQKDVWGGVSESDVYDFLVDFVPKAIQMPFKRRGGEYDGVGVAGYDHGRLVSTSSPFDSFEREMPFCNGVLLPWSSRSYHT